MVSHSLTLESWKVECLRLESESLIILGHFSLFRAKITYIYILIPFNHCFEIIFLEFYIFSAKIVGIIAIFERE